MSSNKITIGKVMGESLRDEGMSVSLSHANDESPGWGEEAYRLLKLFAGRNRGKKFMGEDIRKWATSQGLDTPPSLRAWGSILSKARREGVLKHVGFRAVKNPTAHSTPASLWQAARSNQKGRK